MPGERMPIAPLGVIGLVGAALASAALWNHNASSFGVVSADNFALFVTGVLIVVGLLSLALSGPTIDREHLPRGEYYALVLFALAGMMLMATATDLLVIFLALEVLSIAVYVLTGIRRDSPASTEAAFKYFLLGAFSSAFFLYGIAFVYGLTGSTRLDRIGSVMAAQGAPDRRCHGRRGTAARRLRVQGIGRPVPHVDAGRVPRSAAGGDRFHVHRRQGRRLRGVRPRVPLGARAASRELGRRALACRGRDDDHRHGRGCGPDEREADARVLEHRARRLPAARAALRRTTTARAPCLFYLLTYAITNLGAFGVIGLLEDSERPNDTVTDYAGLWHDHPALAALMTIFMLSLGGFPPMAGFIAKWYVFSAGDQGGLHLARRSSAC